MHTLPALRYSMQQRLNRYDLLEGLMFTMAGCAW
jgi:hypothetical protein